MTLGFTESKADSNLCFKVEYGRSAMLLLCVDALLFYAWKCGQGKHALEILNRFRMMDCMTTPMASNMKILSNASSETVDATMCRQTIGSLIYLMNTRLDICFAVNTLRHVHLMVAKHVGVELIMGSSTM